jgi:hypothetical protein
MQVIILLVWLFFLAVYFESNAILSESELAYNGRDFIIQETGWEAGKEIARKGLDEQNVDFHYR